MMKCSLIYLIPLDACFKVNFVFGEKAVAAAGDADLPDSIAALISQAKPYVEGRSFTFDIKTEADVDVVKKLVEIKHRH